MSLFLVYFGLLFSGMELRMYASNVSSLPPNCKPNFLLLLKRKQLWLTTLKNFSYFPLISPEDPAWSTFLPVLEIFFSLMDSAKMRSALVTRLKSLMSEMSAIKKCLAVETCTPSISLRAGREFLPKSLHSPSWAPTRKNGSEFYWVSQ